MLTAEQKLLRKNGIGGSEAAAVAGVSRWRTPLQVYLDKINKTVEDDKNLSDYQHFGNILEPIVAEEYARRTGKEIIIEDKVLHHSKHPFMLATLDRRIKGDDAILECKTSTAYKHEEWGEPGTDEMPKEYLLQCAHYAAVCDVSRVDVAVLIGGNDFRIYSYRRNPQLESRLITIEADFWYGHVLKLVPPLTSSTTEASKLWPISQAETVKADENIMSNVYELAAVSKKLKELEKKAEILKLNIVNTLQERSTLLDMSGNKLATWKTQTVRRLDQSALQKEHPEIYNKYIVPSNCRVFRLAKEI